MTPVPTGPSRPGLDRSTGSSSRAGSASSLKLASLQKCTQTAILATCFTLFSLSNSSATDGIAGQLGSHFSSTVADSSTYDYEVFLSFRGEDIRSTFTNYLYARLSNAGIHVFRDNKELKLRSDISDELRDAITQSKISIPIFSKNYTSSQWCLREAAHMVKCRKARNQLVLPIFYDVTPHQVREQSGIYGEAFRQHSTCYGDDVVQEWRNALTELGALEEGWERDHSRGMVELELIKAVVSKVWRELQKTHHSAIGVVDRVEEVMKLIQVGADDVKWIAIYGMGGIGKTTLAKIVYNQLRVHFEYCSFLENINDTPMQLNGLEKLQNQLVSDILKPLNPEGEIGSVAEGIKLLCQRFRNKKVLILLDDVSQADQINAFSAHLKWVAGGSRIIITTRSDNVLDVTQVSGTYKVREMRNNEALLLFWKHAFKVGSPIFGYDTLSKMIVSMVGGHPLALEVMGSFLSERNRREWKTTVKNLKEMQSGDVQNILKISINALDCEQKQLFLDIACFFNGVDKRIAAHSEFLTENGIKILHARSLIKVGQDNEIRMHNLLKDLGRDLVRKENIGEPGKRSRLWLGEKARDVLSCQKGTENIIAISLDNGDRLGDYHFESNQVVNLPYLKFLQLCKVNIVGDFQHRLPRLCWLNWHYCPVRLQATNLCLQNLVILNLSESDITDDWNGWRSMQRLSKLKVLVLQSCQQLTRTPEFSRFPALERLYLENCRKLHLVDSSIGNLKKLTYFSLKNCSGLRELPQELSSLEALGELHIDGSGLQELPNLGGLKNLKLLSAKGCISLSNIPPSIGHLNALLELSLDQSGVCILPDSIGALVELRLLSLRECNSIRELPHSIGGLKSLKVLCLSKTSIDTLPDSIGKLEDLQALLVDETKITDLPNAIGKLWNLQVIDASQCKNLKGEILPELGRLNYLTTLKLGRTNITMLPTEICHLERLETLDLTNCNALQTLPRLPCHLRSLSVTCKLMVTLPKEIGNLFELERLYIGNCTELQHIPELPAKLKELKVTGIPAQNLTGLSKFAELKTLSMSWCHQLAELEGLEELESLTELNIEGCGSVETLSEFSKLKRLEKLRIHLCTSMQSLPDLSPLRGLIYLSLSGCKKLRFLEGLGEVVQLEYLNMTGCRQIESLPNLSKLRKLRELILDECENITELRGLEELESLERVSIHRCPSLYQYVKKWPKIPWQLSSK